MLAEMLRIIAKTDVIELSVSYFLLYASVSRDLLESKGRHVVTVKCTIDNGSVRLSTIGSRRTTDVSVDDGHATSARPFSRVSNLVFVNGTRTFCNYVRHSFCNCFLQLLAST